MNSFFIDDRRLGMLADRNPNFVGTRTRQHLTDDITHVLGYKLVQYLDYIGVIFPDHVEMIKNRSGIQTITLAEFADLNTYMLEHINAT